MLEVAKKYVKLDNMHTRFARRRFKSLFSVSPYVVTVAFNRVKGLGLMQEGRIVHLLWALLLLKSYSSETMCAIFVGSTEKTFRKWAWRWIFALAELGAVIVSKSTVVMVEKTKIYFLLTCFVLLLDYRLGGILGTIGTMVAGARLASTGRLCQSVNRLRLRQGGFRIS